MIAQALKKHESDLNTPKKPKTSYLNEKATAVQDDPDQQFKLATETNLNTVATTATTMSSSIADIMTNFNGILNMAGLEKFSATLESVPAVGVLNNTIQYMGISLGNSGVNENWALLDKLPATPSGSDTVSLFSYTGSFYAAVGNNVWQKTPKSAGDPTLPQAATDNWAMIFNPGWQSLGACIPAGDSKCIVPFSSISSDGTIKSSALVRLASDGSLSWAQGPVAVNMVFQPLQPVTGTAPVFVKIAYWNGSLWGYNAQSMLYNLIPVVSANGALTGYNLGDTVQLDQQIKDLTAVDTGLVVAANDGFLYKFIINPPKDQNSPPTTTWDKWVADGGVTNLSAATPGVILDLKTLTNYLKSQYVTTQTNLFPYINQIKGFCGSHSVYLNNLLQAAKDWQAASSPADKAKIANGEGQVAVQHAQVMGQLLSTSLQAANQMIVLMTRQTSQINSSIASQLQNLSTQLDALNLTLNDLEAENRALTAGLWASIAAVIVGIGLVVAGFFFPPAAPYLWVGGGALIIGGVVAVGVISSQLGKLASAIASTKSSIQSLTDSKNQLSTISKSFGDLTSEYGDLTAFWTQMLSVSGSISSLESLGTAILGDQPSIVAAQNFNQEITTALNNYVQVLGSQGIIPPSLAPKPPANVQAMEVPALVDHVHSNQPNTSLHVPMKLDIVSSLMQVAQQQLVTKNTDAYISTMRKAVALNAEAHNLVLF